MFFHFFKSFSDNAKCNLNIKAEGENEHHKIEAIFKAFAKALKMAVKKTDNLQFTNYKRHVMIAILKYNAGNIQSVQNALDRLGFESIVTDNTEELQSADKVIIPGVGEASSAMKYLRERGLDNTIKSLKQPVLGICLGLAAHVPFIPMKDAQNVLVFLMPLSRNFRHLIRYRIWDGIISLLLKEIFSRE